MTEFIMVSHKDLEIFVFETLRAIDIRIDVARYVAEGLCQTSLRGVDSHGVRLLPHYIRAANAGRINKSPTYNFKQELPAVATLDADHTFGHASGATAMNKAIELAGQYGLGSVSVHNSSHFGAAAYFALKAAQADMIGLSFTHADALMLSFNGKRPFFGTNPIAFAAPVKDEDSFCLDMATTNVSWNKTMTYAKKGKILAPGWAVDKDANEITDPNLASSLISIGGYKGFGLSMMIEILCSILNRMPYGRNISSMYKAPIGEKRLLGHFFMVLNISAFMNVEQFKDNMKSLMDDLRAEPSKGNMQLVQVPGDPEKENTVNRLSHGIPIPEDTWQEFMHIAKKTDVKTPEMYDCTHKNDIHQTLLENAKDPITTAA